MRDRAERWAAAGDGSLPLRLAPWASKKTSYSALSRSVTSGSSGCGSPTCSGFLKSVSVAPAELEGAFDEGIGFDGSAIEGFARVYEADMLAKPDPSTFQILPWRGRDGPATARMFCDIVMPDGSPSYADPRHVLKRTLSNAADQGFTFYTHPEIEFYLFKDAPGRRATSRCRSTAAATSTTPRSRAGADFRREAITMLEAMGISVEFSHHEGGPGQQEIDLRYADALTTADNIMTFRTVVREVALGQGIWASFMPKPFTTHPGSGMHTHVSLFEGDRNAFFEAGAEYQLSKTGPAVHRRHPAPRQRDQRASPTSGSTPTSGCSAAARRPSSICWGHNNRSAMIRVPMYKPNKGQSTRIELRTIDAACNPYLAFAVMLAAGMKGIEEGYELPREAEDDVWSLTERERKALGISAAAQEPVRTRSASRRTPSCSPRRSASTSSTSSCATSARSGRSTAPRSPPTSATGCCRSSEHGGAAHPRRRAPGVLPAAPRRAAGSSEAGCTLEVCRPYAGDALPGLTSYDGVLVLGGEMGANDDDTVRVAGAAQGADPRRGRGRARRCWASAWATS